ncbi:MAG TPA: nucleotide disphospho-sugar-binding domain-containing protein [Mycobacterium sp.]
MTRVAAAARGIPAITHRVAHRVVAAACTELVPPLGTDQFYNGEAVASAGVGGTLEPAGFSGDEVAAAVERLLTESSFRAAAGALRREIAAMPHPRDVLPTIMDVARRAA